MPQARIATLELSTRRARRVRNVGHSAPPRSRARCGRDLQAGHQVLLVVEPHLAVREPQQQRLDGARLLRTNTRARAAASTRTQHENSFLDRHR
eukprot:6208641-Pleurochrysis_carterae.AAC.1